MFDPFEDFQTAGYLRNVEALRDLEKVKVQEHVFFEANLEEALTFLRKVKGPREQPGTVMGAFAWGHPFLDGNGRTMLLVHAELCCFPRSDRREPARTIEGPAGSGWSR